MFKFPVSEKYIWTRHAQAKMAYYKISPSRVKRIIKTPKRIEEGIATGTKAFMQPISYKFKDGKKIWSQEYWVMVADKNIKDKNKIKIISAWRYPAVTKPGVPLPKQILDEIAEALINL